MGSEMSEVKTVRNVEREPCRTRRAIRLPHRSETIEESSFARMARFLTRQWEGFSRGMHPRPKITRSM